MSTALISPPDVERIQPAETRPPSASLRKWAFIPLLTVAAIAVHGYHPYSEDGGIYVPAIKKLLDPALYPHSAQFFLAPARLSIFSNIVAATIRATHLPLSCALLLWHAVTVALLFAGCWRFSRLCFGATRVAQCGPLLVAAFLTVPVAGSSLMLSDPYLTSRSMATPALIFALCFLLEERLFKATLVFLLAFAVHPLMAAYGGVFLLSLWAIRKRKLWLLPLVAGCIFSGVLLALQMAKRFPASASYRDAVLTRTYFFLSQWAWYEIFGIVAPLCLFTWVIWRERDFLQGRLGSCALAAFLNGAFFALLALLFTRTSNQLAVERYQPMRSFHLLYILMFLLPVSLLAQRTLERGRLPFALFLAVTACGMFAAQRYSFPAGSHLELPGMHCDNPWQRAFEWARLNTPKDALFALDPDYLNAPGVDRRGFRAVAERSALADRSKDGGVVAVFPNLAEEWINELREADAADRPQTDSSEVALRQAGVTWIVTNAEPGAALDCPYRSGGVAVCHLPERLPVIVNEQPHGAKN
jgi:hypothetical protein